MIASGIALALVVMLLFGRSRTGAGWLAIFLAIWLVVTLANLWFGVARAGYGLAEEIPINLVVFAVPAIVAFGLRKFSTR